MFGRKQHIKTNPEQISEALTRGVAEIIGEESLKKKLSSGDQLRIKLGIDPTGSDIHIGHAIQLLKLRDFQSLGHKIVLIIGDATGVVGDTSDKESERPMLSRKEINRNKKTYIQQASKVLDMSDVEVRHNSEWLDKLTFDEIGEQADHFSVADFIARDNVKRRLDAGKRVSLREMIYPLMQGYDSVAVEADVELGGTDQRFNLLAGRTLQKHYKQEEQSIVMSDLIEGTDGNKMSKSQGNTINLFDTADDMYGKAMRVHDDLVEKYFILTTRVPENEYKTILSGHPRDAKMRLARELVEMYHNKNAAEKAEKNFIEAFSEGGTPENVQELHQIENVRKTAIEAKIISSNSEWKRLIDAGAVKNMETEEAITDVMHVSAVPETLKIGKRKFVKILPK